LIERKNPKGVEKTKSFLTSFLKYETKKSLSIQKQIKRYHKDDDD
jgi:hypothetical protein